MPLAPARIIGLALVSAIGVLATAGVTTSTAEAAPRATKCYPRKATTMQASAEVRVYKRRGKVVACSLSTGKKVTLGPTTGPSGVLGVALGGKYAAIVRGSSPEGAGGPFSSQSLSLLNVTTRRPVSFGQVGCSGIDSATVTIQSLAVTTAGQLAWICAATSPTASRAEVHKFDRSGASLLDSSDSISSPDSIALESVAIGRSESAVYWSRGDTARVAPLR
jgi:hypothetical protein